MSPLLELGEKQKSNDMARRTTKLRATTPLCGHYCQFVRAWLYEGIQTAHELTEAWMRVEGRSYMDLKFQTA